MTTPIILIVSLAAVAGLVYFLKRAKCASQSTICSHLSYLDQTTRLVLIRHNNKAHLLLLNSKGNSLVLDTYSDVEKIN